MADASAAAIVDAVIQSSAAALPTSYIVSLFKSARPSASTAMIILVAVAGGLLVSFLIAFAQGVLVAFSAAGVSMVLLQAITAAAMAAGVSRTDSSAKAVVAGQQQ
jgi:hypothetical protein